MSGPPKPLKGEKNMFGGANPHGLYVPITDTEQEVLLRLIEAGDLRVVVHDWGVVTRPRISFGDLRLCVEFRLSFDRPEAPMPVHFFDLELQTGSGMTLFREKQPTLIGGKPIEVAAGVFFDMAWDIALSHIDPKVVKTIKPGAIGMTSRRLDRDTGMATLNGNMKLDRQQREVLAKLLKHEAQLRAEHTQKIHKLSKK